jgi:hypothetical protein
LLRRALPLVLLACASDRPATIPDAGAQSFARLHVMLTAPRDGQVSLSTAARLLRYRDLDAESAYILAGAGQDLGTAGAVGRCVALDQDAILDEALATASPDAAVQMLDAGEVTVRVAGLTLRLSPHYVSEVHPFVSGVLYEAESPSDDGVAGELAAQDEALVSAFGGDDVGRFDTQAEVPALPRVTLVRTVAGGDLEVRWSVATVGAELNLVLRAGTGEVRCRANDIGAFVIPRSAFSTLNMTEGMLVSVERSSRTPLSAPGLDAGEVVVTVRDLVAVEQF